MPLLALLAVLLPNSHATPRTPLLAPPGFEVSTIYEVPSDQGSWVCLTSDPQGRLITSDQFGRLYRLTLPTDGHPLTVDTLDLGLGFAQGLLCAFDSLYVVVNRGPDQGGSGLYRARDTNGDDLYDHVEIIREFDGHGEHGPHAIVLGPDGQSLYLIAGNATRLPQPEQSLVPRVWAADELLPHLMQTDGIWRHDRPGGWICRLDPSGQNWELLAVGLRNPYDLAFNADGQLFTFDADMEWDLGTPWYRPTRVNHVTSGAEFGWRTGSAKWPDDTIDSLGSVIDIGESSPTGLAFGYQSHFPPRYQRALFMGDWSYGKIYCVHLQPQGSSYSGAFEQFVSGMPLPVTDLIVHPSDGALYFIVGGRQTPSQLYRVRYRGDQPNENVDAHQPDPEALRAQRRALEGFHGRQDPAAVTSSWPYLDHPDRHLRFAARTALEHQPISQWQNQALHEPNPRRALAALVALARCSPPSLQPRLLEALARFKFTDLALDDQKDLLRAYTLALTRFGPPDSTDRSRLLEYLNPLFPAATFELNRPLSHLLIALRAPNIVDRALNAMSNARTQEEALHYSLGLRTLPPDAWSDASLSRYLLWHNAAMTLGGGVTFAEYLVAIRSSILDEQPEDRQKRLKQLIHTPPPPSPLDQLKQRDFVQEWTVSDLLETVDQGLTGRNYDQGRSMFGQAMCLKCHRFRGEGGLTGPDLTGVAARFDARTLIESILEPSKVVSDQYATIKIITKDGEEHTGRIGDQTDEEVLLKFDLFNPANLERIRYDHIERIEPSSVSLMPTNLLDYFSQEEILDLIAYLQAQGHPDHAIFQ